MDAALDKLRAEVSTLQREEQSKLESQKREILDRIHNQVHRNIIKVLKGLLITINIVEGAVKHHHTNTH